MRKRTTKGEQDPVEVVEGLSKVALARLRSGRLEEIPRATLRSLESRGLVRDIGGHRRWTNAARRAMLRLDEGE